MKKGFKLVSVLLTVTLMMLFFVTPVAARQGDNQGRGQDRQTARHIRYLDAEVKVINGQPVIVVETKKGYVNVPLVLSGEVFVDGRAVPARLQGNGLVVPTEDGDMVVPLEEFEPVVVGGQMVLVAEENPIILLFIFAGAVAGGVAGGAAGGAAVAPR